MTVSQQENHSVTLCTIWITVPMNSPKLHRTRHQGVSVCMRQVSWEVLPLIIADKWQK